LSVRPDPAGTGPRIVVAGNASVDLLLGPVTPWPEVGTEVLADRYGWRVGGALGNTALALAGMGVPATLVWDVGDDLLSSWLRTELAHAGDAPRTLAAPASITVALTHPSGERTFVSHLGHLATSEPDALGAAIERARAGDLLLVGGSFLLPRWRPALPTLLARARARGLVTALDTGWPSEGWTEAVRGELRATLAHVDLFLPNLDEARGLLGDAVAAPGDPVASPGAALRAIAPLVAGRTALKLGRDGAALLDGDDLVVAAAPRVPVADTVGAGDTFNAVVLAGLRDGLPLRTALRLAVEVTSDALTTTPRRLPAWDGVHAAAGGRG